MFQSIEPEEPFEPPPPTPGMGHNGRAMQQTGRGGEPTSGPRGGGSGQPIMSESREGSGISTYQIQRARRIEEIDEEVKRQARFAGVVLPDRAQSSDYGDPEAELRARERATRSDIDRLDGEFQRRGMDRRQIPGETEIPLWNGDGSAPGQYDVGGYQDLGGSKGYEKHHIPPKVYMEGSSGWDYNNGTAVRLTPGDHRGSPRDSARGYFGQGGVHSRDVPPEQGRGDPYGVQESHIDWLQQHQMPNPAAQAIRERNLDLYAVRPSDPRPDQRYVWRNGDWVRVDK